MRSDRHSADERGGESLGMEIAAGVNNPSRPIL